MLEATFNKKYLRHQWSEIHAILSATSEPSRRIDPDWEEFEWLMSRYKEKGRYYHGVRHLVHGLDMMRQLFVANPPTMRDGALVRLAFFYHDVIYDVKSKDNEVESAGLCNIYMSQALGLAPAEMTRVFNLIVATKDHQGSTLEDTLWPYMNDADLAIMAAPERVYEKYSKKVWQEYRAVASRPQFVTGRMAFITAFNSKPIFKTRAMMLKEGTAKGNLVREYLRLSGEAEKHEALGI